MSTEQSVDPELVEQTKQQIRNLVREIAQLSKSELSPLEYYDALLNRVVSALAAVGGAVWTLTEGRLNLEYQINLRETRLIESPEDQQRHGQLLQKILQTGEGALVAPHSGAGNEEEGANPTDFLLVLGPLKTDQDTQGVIEVFQRPGSSRSVQQGYLRFLLQMCELAGDYLKTRRLRHFTDRQTLWAQLEQFTRSAHRSLDPRSTAYTIANEGRRLIECDRVSVGICKGRKCVIEAVSGQDTFDKRSNTVALLGRLATAVTNAGEPVWYTGDTSQFAPQIEEAVQEYIDESHSKAVGIIPLKRPVEATERDKNSDPAEVIGAIIIEQIEDNTPRDGMLQRVEVVTDHSATALANAMEYHSLFLLPVWQALGKAQWVLRARTLPKTIAITSAVVALLLWLVFWPASFELEGKGTLEPVNQQEVWANIDGTVDKVLVTHGQMVKKGDELVRMHSTDLQNEWLSIAGKRNEAASKLRSAQQQLDKGGRRKNEDIQLQGEIHALQISEETFEKQLKKLEEKMAQLVVKSPIDGQVTTWQPELELLLGRSVKQGNKLMSIVDFDGEWELEIHMPEDRMGHVAQAQKDLKQDLPVRFILTTDPRPEHQGTIKAVHGHAEVRPDEGNTVLVRVTLDKKQLRPTDMRPGVTATARIYCGRASVGYKYFHELIAFVQSKILFRL